MSDILTALNDFKRAGYRQVSLSEIAYKTKQPRQRIITFLQKQNVKTHAVMGELYIVFSSTPTIQAHLLPRPKRSFGDLT